MKIRIIVAVLALLGLIGMLRLSRKKKFDLRYGLPWLALIAAALVLCAFPRLLNFLARLAGVAVPLNLLILVGFCLVLVMVFYAFCLISRQADRIKVLTQQLALLTQKSEQVEQKKVSDEQK